MAQRGTHKGFYKLINPQKYRGRKDLIIYRSSWEHRLMKKFDLASNVIEWSSEEIIIRYRSPVDGKPHRYFTDFFVKVRQADGTIKSYLLEIKPQNQVDPPMRPKRMTNAFKMKAMRWEVNMAKWKAAKQWCEQNDVEWLILTERNMRGFS